MATPLQIINQLTTEACRSYVLSLYSDTRIDQEIAKQEMTPPVIIDYLAYLAGKQDFVDDLYRDITTTALSVMMKKTTDPFKRLAIYYDYQVSKGVGV